AAAVARMEAGAGGRAAAGGRNDAGRRRAAPAPRTEMQEMNLFKPCAVFLASAGLAAASLAASAIETKGEGGSVCRPVTPADAAVVSYPQGAVVASAPARVSCALTGSLPGHRQVGAMIAFYSDTRQWKKSQCRFFNAFPSR